MEGTTFFIGLRRILSLIPNMRPQNNQNRSFFFFFFLFLVLSFSPPFSTRIRSRSILDSKNSKMNRDDRRSSSAHIYIYTYIYIYTFLRTYVSYVSPLFSPIFLPLPFSFLSLSLALLSYYLIFPWWHAPKSYRIYLHLRSIDRVPRCFISLVIASQLSRSNVAKRYVSPFLQFTRLSMDY